MELRGLEPPDPHTASHMFEYMLTSVEVQKPLLRKRFSLVTLLTERSGTTANGANGYQNGYQDFSVQTSTDQNWQQLV